MKRPSLLALSLIGNLMLAVIFLLARKNGPTTQPDQSGRPFSSAHGFETTPLPVAKQAPPARLPWDSIASADYRQYLANLRAVGCPDWLVRDILVTDIDDLYKKKYRTEPAAPVPWQAADQNRQTVRSQSAQKIALRREKRTLVQSLLGYEWENYAELIWQQDLLTSLTLGFLPDDKASQAFTLKNEYNETAQHIREDANYILIAEDRKQLQSLYEKYLGELSRQLDASEYDELQLRAQQSFLLANDLHFDGVNLSQLELREIIRYSKSVRDLALNEFVPDHPLSEAEQATRNAAFAIQLQNLLGPQRFADYQRAQDFNFREIFAFSQQNHLPPTVAVQVYESRRNASEQADEIQKDASLSADERATALAVLKAATMNSISSALGGSYQDYLAGSGQWLEVFAQPPQMQAQSQPQ
jgi:hypothetical protein